MRMFYLYLVMMIIISACKSIDLPTAEESRMKHSIAERKTDSVSMIIRDKVPLSQRNQTSSDDIALDADIKFINKLTSSIANQRLDDLKLNFFRKQYFMKEDMNVLGINYTNHLDIDTGFVSLNFKKFNLTSMSSDKINAIIEIEGKGFIKVSGKHTGIPASVSPDVVVYLYEPVVFSMKTNQKGNVLIVPDKKTLLMKTKFYVSLLEWKVPFYQEIKLELADILQPMELPMTMSSEISLPMPAQKFGKDNIQFGVFEMLLMNQKISSDKNKLLYKSDMNLRKK